MGLTWTENGIRTNVRYLKGNWPLEGPSGDLERMKNLGPISAARLRAVGVETAEDLRRLGAVEAYVRLRRAFPV